VPRPSEGRHSDRERADTATPLDAEAGTFGSGFQAESRWRQQVFRVYHSKSSAPANVDPENRPQ
jgi:hypothetical protein